MKHLKRLSTGILIRIIGLLFYILSILTQSSIIIGTVTVLLFVIESYLVGKAAEKEVK